MTESSSPASSPHDESISSQSHSTCHSPPPPFIVQQTAAYSSSRPTSQHSAANSPSPNLVNTKENEDDRSESSPNPNDIVQIKMEIGDDEVLPRLRLNIGLASDPALQPDAKDIKGLPSDEHMSNEQDERSSDTSSPFPIVTPNSVLLSEITRRAEIAETPIPPIIVASGDPIVRTAGFVCDPCGIKFSSLSTLEAHQTYYCSHNRKEGDGPPIVIKAGSSTEQAGSSSNSEHPHSNITTAQRPQPLRTGKQYACNHCSYSADKKVSLNRHMRMHQSSPATSSLLVSLNGDGGADVDSAGVMAPSQMQLADRYCSDCDIPFSSTKTYRAHKQHYCSGRQRDG